MRALAAGLCVLLLVVSASAQHVVINEFIAKGTEWIELYNAGGSPATLTGWYVQDAGGTDTAIDGVTIPANGYYTWSTSLGHPGRSSCTRLCRGIA